MLEAAKKVVRQSGYSKLSTRDVAAAAGAPVSQIHYHFGSKQGMVLALFEYLNAQLLDRQGLLFDDVTLKVSEQWEGACDYLDEDIALRLRPDSAGVDRGQAGPTRRSARSCAPDSWAGSKPFDVSPGEPSKNSEALAPFRLKSWLP